MNNNLNIGQLIDHYLTTYHINKSEFAREIGKIARKKGFDPSYASLWIKGENITPAHFQAMVEYFKKELKEKFNEEQFQEAYERYEATTEGKDAVNGVNVNQGPVDPSTYVSGSALGSASASGGINGDDFIKEDETSTMNSGNPWERLDERATRTAKKTGLVVGGVALALFLGCGIFYIIREAVGLGGGILASQNTRLEATRQAYATATKEASELTIRLTSESVNATMAADSAKATVERATVQAVALATREYLAAVATDERATSVAIARATDEAFEAVVSANATATARSIVLTLQASTPTPLPTFTPTWTPQPTYTPSNTPEPSITPTGTPLPTQTPYPTDTATPRPTVTPTPTNTPIPNTDPGTMLAPGETWYEDGLALRMEVLALTTRSIEISLYLTNLTNQTIFVDWGSGDGNLALLGNGGSYIGNLQYGTVLSTPLEPGQRRGLHYAQSSSLTTLRFYQTDTARFDYIVVQVRGLSRIDQARWKIEIPR